MSFLHPYFLFGLSALVIPVIIHLFDFRRTKKVYFSNTRLLDQVKESTRSFYNLKHILILISRMLFITALVLAFAQPIITPNAEGGLSSSQVGIFIDNSNSMSNRVGRDESGLSMAKETAIEIINLYPSGTEFMVQSAFEESSMNFYLSKSSAVEKINNLGFTSNAWSMQAILERFKSTTGSQAPNELILVSDFQEATLFQEKLDLDSQQHYILAPVLFESYRNVTIDSAYISNPFELDKTKTNLAVKVRNYSSEEMTDLPVKLFLGERQLSVTTVDVPANSHTTINITVGQTSGEESGYVIIEDFPLSFDNALYFSLRTINKVNISQIIGNGAGRYISAVFGNDALFNLVTMPESNINYTTLESSDIIILNGLEQLDQSLTNRLLALNQKGVSLFIVPPYEPDIGTYSTLVPQLTSVTGAEDLIEIEVPDFSRPFYQNVLERREDNLQMPEAQQSWSWGGDRNALLKYIDGQPYLSELRPGMYILASPLNPVYSNFQSNALFVPVMYRIAANSQQNIDPLYYRIGRNEISIKSQELQSNAIIRLKNESMEFLPDQRLTGTSIDILLPQGVIPAGHYDIYDREELLKSIALNYRTDESVVKAMTETELDLLFSGTDYNIVSGTETAEIVSKFSADYQGIELWRYFLGLALVFLFIEALLIRLL